MFQRRGREGASSADTSVVFFIEEEAGGEAGDEGGEYEVLEEHFEEEEALVASSAREFSDESADVVVRGAGRDAGVAAVGRDGGGGEGGESREKGDRVGHFHAQVRHEHDVVEDVERRGGVVDGVVALRDAHGRHEHREDARRDHLHYERQRACVVSQRRRWQRAPRQLARRRRATPKRRAQPSSHDTAKQWKGSLWRVVQEIVAGKRGRASKSRGQRSAKSRPPR
mmetsp:Transcript_15812/g.47813  ORF Transcript_15812/g.47813 Transcript_15812/m.47813 type:complete len:226 (-) Transcript_15812:150-827(-)